MERCDQCGHYSKNVYRIDPKTGKPRRGWALCHNCYEMGLSRSTRELTREAIVSSMQGPLRPKSEWRKRPAG